MFDQNHRCEVKTPQARSRYNAAVRCRAVHGSCARRCCVHKFLACCLDDEFKKGADCCLLTFWWGVIDRVWGCTYSLIAGYLWNVTINEGPEDVQLILKQHWFCGFIFGISYSRWGLLRWSSGKLAVYFSPGHHVKRPTAAFYRF